MKYKQVYCKDSKKTKYEHRMIWRKHYGTIPSGYHIHHIDGNKSNNEITNLEMIEGREHNRIERTGYTYSDETIQKRKQTRRDHTLTDKVEIRCVETGVIFESISDAAKFLKGTKGNICNSLNGRQPRAYGYHWEY